MRPNATARLVRRLPAGSRGSAGQRSDRFHDLAGAPLWPGALPPRDSDHRELFLGPRNYLLLYIPMENISWAWVTFLGVVIARRCSRIFLAQGIG
jgi:hypothetical protein